MLAKADSAEATALAPHRQHGRLELELAQAGGATYALRSLANPPIQISRARYGDPHAPEAATFTLLHLGGVLAGDRAQMQVRLHEGAQAQIVMASATQVYQMPKGDAAHTLDLRLDSGSRLAWLAQPLILFAQARFTQHIQVALGPSARLDLLDVLVPGRLARGERDQFQRYESRLEIANANGRCLVAERALIEPARHSPAVPGVLAGPAVLGSLYLLGESIDAERRAAELHREHQEGFGVAVLPNNAGLLVRVVGSTPSAVHQQLMSVWESCG